MSKMWKSSLAVGPWLTEALGLKATNGAPTLQLLIVPGNPGLGQFYNVLIHELHALFQGTADVMAVSNLGHDPDNLSDGRVWCLNTQIQHKVQLLKEHVMAPGKPPAVVLAHSIGSYMMLQAIKQIEEERAAAGQPADTTQQLPRVVLLMPFLATDWSSRRQRLLRFASRFYKQAGSLVGVLQRLPEWLLDTLVAIAEPGAEPHTREGIKAMMNPSGVRNNLHLAMHEFRDLDQPVDWEPIRRLGQRAVLVCAPDDIWYPMHHYFATQQAVPGIEEYYSDKLTHGFCCHTKQCQLVAQLVHLSVKKLLHPADVTAQDQQLEVSNAATEVSNVATRVSNAAMDMSVLLGEQEGPKHSAVAAAAPAGLDAASLKQGLKDTGGVKQRQARQPAPAVA